MCESTDLITWVINCSAVISDSSLSCFRRCVRATGSPCWPRGTPTVPSHVPRAADVPHPRGQEAFTAVSPPALGWVITKSEQLKPGVRFVHPSPGVWLILSVTPGLFSSFNFSRPFWGSSRCSVGPLSAGCSRQTLPRLSVPCPQEVGAGALPRPTRDGAGWSFSTRSET